MSPKTKSNKTIPFPFILEALEPASPFTKPMFGCIGVYVGEKIVFALRDKDGEPEDNGLWIATTIDHHASLGRDFPSIRSIGVLGPPPTGWQILPSSSSDFEKAAIKACELVLAGDVRIGKVPKQKRLKPRITRERNSRGT